MRPGNVLSSHALVAAGLLGLAGCSSSNPSDFDPQEEPVTPLSDQRTSTATRIASDGTGNCNFDPSPEDLSVAALSPTEYAEAAKCGACAELEGPNQKKVRVRIVDSCSGCGPEDIGVSPQVFESMGAGDLLKTSIRWRYITCPTQGPVRYRFKEDSSPYWVAIQVRNHVRPIQRLEWDKGGTWVEVARQPYNYFVEPSGMGAGPLHLRITSTDGQKLEDTLPSVAAGTVVDGSSQFSD